ncbi:hypothetical protein BS78_06G219700 [Paspalum vaginatum]|nr:hypothetical protein BS78_06G219700 [Paspalum vaginatum]
MWHVEGEQRVRGFPDPPAGVPWCCGMSRGWLALSDHEKSPTRLLLWDPSSGAEVFLAEDPLASPHWMALATLEGSGSLLFWRPGNNPSVDNIAFHDGKMFFNGSRDRLLVYDLNLGTTSPPTFVRELCLDAAVAGPSVQRHGYHYVRAVACNGDLLVVVLDATWSPCLAEVYMPAADWAPAAGQRRRSRLQLCDKVTDLGGYSLFIGRGDTLALRADDVLGIKGNHVYVLPQQPHNFHWLFTFDLASGVSKGYLCEDKHRGAGNYLWPYSWFCLKTPFFNK